MNNVHNAFVAGQKRRLSESECRQVDVRLPVQEQPEPKQRKTDLEQDQEEPHDHNLLSFCNELLFEIFKYLDSSSIMAMMQ